MKKEFTERLEKLMNRKKSNSINYITEPRYKDFIHEVKTLKNKWPKGYEDYKTLANYDVLEVKGRERLVKPKDEGDSIIKFYLPTNELFGAIHTMHVLYDHADVDVLEAHIKSKYCNVSKEVIKMYLLCCKVCNKCDVREGR